MKWRFEEFQNVNKKSAKVDVFRQFKMMLSKVSYFGKEGIKSLTNKVGSFRELYDHMMAIGKRHTVLGDLNKNKREILERLFVKEKKY